MRAAFIYSPELEQYSYPPDCPFSTRRAGMTRQTLCSMGLLEGQDRAEVPTRRATREDLLAYHTEGYLRALEQASKGDLDAEGLHMGLGTPDTPIFTGMYEYAELAVGASLVGADLILSGQAQIAFNPSGGYHHAHRQQASGFCYVNDVVLACLRLAANGKRVMVLDIDAHHCDGVQEAFYDRSDVMTLSFHEDGRTLFPGTGWEDEIGAGEGRGYTANVPLPAGLYDDAFLKAFRAVGLPLIGAYRPDVIVLELGMDMLAGDPLTHLCLTNNASAEVVEAVRKYGRAVLAVGGGGYNLPNTARAWALAWTVLCGDQDGTDAMNLGLGGVMLQTTDWLGGLRDRMLSVEPRQKAMVDQALGRTIEKVKRNLFPLHGL